MRSLTLLDQTGSIQEVAARVHLTPAAVHRQLKSLEREFGVLLYGRSGGRLKLTAAGRVLLPYVRDAVAQHDAARGAMLNGNKVFKGSIRIGAGPTFSSHILPSLIGLFRQRCPGIELLIESGASGQLLDRLSEGELDLAFDVVPTAPADPRFEQVVLWKSQLAFATASGLIQSPCTLHDLQDYPFILFQKGSRMDQVVQSYMDQLHFRPKVIIRSDSAEAIKAMIRSRLGVSVLFVWNIASDPQIRTLSVLQIEAKPFSASMALMRGRSKHSSPGTREFIAVAKNLTCPSLELEDAAAMTFR